MGSFVHHAEACLGEGAAHPREGLRAAEVVVAGIRGASLPERDFRGGDEAGFELVEVESGYLPGAKIASYHSSGIARPR